MGRDALADRETVLTSLAAAEAAHAQLADCSLDAFSPAELMEVLCRLEALAWRAPVIEQQILARLVTEGDAGALGACSLTKALGERLRISSAAARRRVAEAADLGPRTAMTGEPLEPVLPALAAARAAGKVGPEHVAIARKTMDKIPAGVSAAERVRAETDLAEMASQYGPEIFGRLADHLLAVLDPDGDFTDRERQARRGLRLGRQRPDGMSTLSGTINPELRATLEPVLAKLAAPGMCNADDEHPCVSGTPSQEQITGDHRRPDQRRHDALLAALRMTLACGDLGQLNGLPVTVIVTATLAEIEAGAGKAHTGGGSLLPMSDLLRMAGHAHHYLTIFDGKGRALWLGRTKRLASGDQRIVLHARDHGCTRPGCSVSGYLSQAHHLQDWAKDGHTDVDDLALACAPDNRMASEQGWTTQLGHSGRVEWIPPPHLDHGQPRVNPYHFIEAVIDYHRRDDDADDEVDDVPDPQPPPPGWPDLDEPLPGEPGYDEAFEGLCHSYDIMDYDELAKRHWPDDDWEQTG